MSCATLATSYAEELEFTNWGGVALKRLEKYAVVANWERAAIVCFLAAKRIINVGQRTPAYDIAKMCRFVEILSFCCTLLTAISPGLSNRSHLLLHTAERLLTLTVLPCVRLRAARRQMPARQKRYLVNNDCSVDAWNAIEKSYC